MSDERDKDRFLELILAALDGQAVDWARLEEAAQTPADRKILEQIQTVASVAAVHREDLSMASAARAHATRVGVPGQWGKLRVLKFLAEGIFGEVYRALDPDLEREVALKLFWPRTTDDTGAESARREARFQASVRHAHIVAVHGVEFHDGRWGIWQELVRGFTLAQLLQRQGRYSADEAILVGLQLCDALSAVHAAGLVHLDVKAQNVIREEGGRFVLTDFGSAHEIGGATVVSGTPAYVAPELLLPQPEPATARSDLYSLGVLLFHLATNEFPYYGVSFDDVREAHALGLRVRASDFRPDLPEPFVAVLDRALCVQPEGRYQSARAMRLDLESALRRHPTTATVGASDSEAKATSGRAAERAARISVFVSYSHEDARVVDKLKILSYLKDLESDGCDVWSDHELTAGDDWRAVITGRIRSSHILVPLVTQNYLRSQYCREVELQEFLRRRMTEGLAVYPIIVSPSEWERHDWLRAIQCLPPRGTLLDYRGTGKKEQLLVKALGELRRIAARIRDDPQGGLAQAR